MSDNYAKMLDNERTAVSVMLRELDELNCWHFTLGEINAIQEIRDCYLSNKYHSMNFAFELQNIYDRVMGRKNFVPR